MLYTEPRILHSKTGIWSVYFSFTYPGGKKKFYRISQGKEFGLEGRGNGKEFSTTYKRKYFQKLRDIISKELENGWIPGGSIPISSYSLDDVLKTCLKSLDENQKLNNRYKVTLKRIESKLRVWYKKEILLPASKTMTSQTLYNFLQSYTVSPGYFNNQKAHLGAFLSPAVSHGMLTENPTSGIKRVRESLTSNMAFSVEQIQELFEKTQQFCPNLYLACILMYTTLLRPHIEIRLLKRGYFNDDLSVLVVPGNYTKNGKGRNIPISPSVQTILTREYSMVDLPQDAYVFGKLYSPGYFSLRWRKFKERFPRTVSKGQTFYSFRHSAAIEIFNKTGSIQKVKLAMDHSDISVTLSYLRSLDIYESLISLSDLPDI